MTVEIFPDGGVEISGTPHELMTLASEAAAALHRGCSHASFLTEEGVSRFVVKAEPDGVPEGYARPSR